MRCLDNWKQHLKQRTEIWLSDRIVYILCKTAFA